MNLVSIQAMVGFIIFIVFITIYYYYHLRSHRIATCGLSTCLLKQSNYFFLKIAHIFSLSGVTHPHPVPLYPMISFLSSL